MTIRAALQPFVDSNALAGAVTLVAAPTGVSLAGKALGYSDHQAKILMQDDQLFWIASTSKPLTGVAVMMLRMRA